MNFKDKLKAIDWKHVFILILIFLVAFGIRAHILRYDLLFGFDSYWHARMNGEFINTGHIPKYDLIGTYHNANKAEISLTHGPVFWMFGYLAYKIVFPFQPYNEAKWIWLVRFLPALYGALAALGVYLAFKWAYDSKKIGYIAGFVTAVLPGFVYRTMGGFYEEDAMGFMLMAFALAFLVKALKNPELTKEKIIMAGISGILFALMGLVWDVFVIVPLILELYFIGSLIWNWYVKADKQKLKSFVVLFLIIFIFSVGIVSALKGFYWLDIQIRYGKGFLGLSGGASISNAASGIGEESPGHYVFGKKFGVFNIFIVFAILYLFYRATKEREDYVSLIWIFTGLLTFYLAWNKLKATYWYGFGLALLTAYVFAETINYAKLKDISFKIFAVVVGVLLLSGGLASGVLFVHNHAPSIDTQKNWKDTLLWMRNNLPENAKMFNWWSWGHWITFIGHKRASTDNTNSDPQANTDFAYFVIDNNLTTALGILKAYDADYVILSAEDVSSAEPIYANQVYKNTNDYRVQKYFGSMYFSCHPETRIGKKVNVCYSSNGYGITLTQDQMDAIAFTWQSKPTDIYQGKLPVFYYRTKDNKLFWTLTPAVNESMAAKLWFNNPEVIKYFELVYDNGYQKIWKIKKEMLKDIPEYMYGLNESEIKEWNNKAKKFDEMLSVK